ncbi:CZB domain-containing protein [Bdellovibrio bacteriovorus]|uniref:Chemoreceptor zinc-binding domain-containing protein n=1 Tax=Bdellovibrio bacteriovorus (strain ATCC 15356 / DSM 50701 / NCIMB 9529 / HD100) TaxID=264462 RepID=Q6MIV5_BDEBA|nr:CZB domain-containing protein [Bdellovibrio bacteriovorus]AHZ83436.1 hypothetical protein EP01_00540 [Bdellovibrio bacteriovorus]BEV69405.1 hypothetical protein Bb109J_c2825 [Bdellovibrio bacteriovorus]CAE80808.1 hypothetical protein predicted by Glimmer/Critica [Bdellovibrio bacteriovorus HD100]
MKTNDIVLAHAKYKLSLRNFVENGSELQVPDEDLLFWLRDNKRSLSHLPAFQHLEKEHEAFCNYVSAVLTLVDAGQRSQARELIKSEMFVLLSEEIVSSIAVLERAAK